MVFIGIDAGLSGALTVLSAQGDIELLVDTPTLEVKSRTKIQREYQIPEMDRFFKQYVNRAVAALEDIHALPGEAIRAAFSIGKGIGIWQGLLVANGLPYEMIAPQRWKAAMLCGMGREKEAARFRAQQLFPTADLSLKKHHGRAESLLLAEYLRRIRTNSEGGDVI